jgi:AcrR family transcriptional regulator
MPDTPSPPREKLTRARIMSAALELADAEGLDRLTMRRLAVRLGIEAMSLYHHVAGKEDLLSGITDLVIGEIALPPAEGDWQAAMRLRSISAHQVLMRHPWAAALIVSRINVGPNMLHYIERTLDCLVRAGFSDPMADHAWNAVDAFVYGFTLQQQNFPIDPCEYASAAEAYLPTLSAASFPNLHRMTRLVAGGAHDGVQQLGFGLDLILSGLDRLRDTARS